MAKNTVRISYVSDTRGLKKGTQEAEGMLAGLNSKGKAALSDIFNPRNLLAGAGAGVGVGSVVALFGSTVQAASSLNEEINKSKVVFGGAAQSILAWSKTTADSFGISERAALSAAGGFGNMLRTTGLAGEESAKMSQRLVELAADMASFNNQDPSEMLEKLRAGLAGEAEPLRTVGVLLSEARVKEEAYATGIARTGVALTEAEKVQARYSLILKDTTLQQGDFARTSDSLANSQRTLKANIEDLSASIGSVLVPALADATSLAVDFVNALNNAGDKVGWLDDKIGDLSGGFLSFGDTVLAAQGPLGQAVLIAKEVKDAFDGGAEATDKWDKIVQNFNQNMKEAGKPSKALATTLDDVFTAMEKVAESAGKAAEEGGALASYTAVLEAAARAADAMATAAGTAASRVDAVTSGFTQDSWPFQGFGLPTGPGAAGGATFPLPAGTKFERGGGPQDHAAGGRGSGWESLNAIDIHADPGTPVLAVVSGTIDHTGGRSPSEGTVKTSSGAITYGQSVTLNGDDGVQYFYTHMDSLQVSGGQKVNKGQVIGYIAAWKENPDKAHVHFAVSKGSPEAIYGAGQVSTTGALKSAPVGTTTQADQPTATATAGLPKGIRLAMTRAGISPGKGDDLRALKQAETFLEKRIQQAKTVEEKIELYDSLGSIKSQIQSIEDAPGVAFELPKGLRLALRRAGLSETSLDDMSALEKAEAFIEKRLAKVKKIEQRIDLLGALSDIRSQIDAITEAAEAEKAEKEKKRIEAALIGIDSISDKVHTSIERLGIMSARIVDVKDESGKVIGREIAGQTDVRYNPVKGLWETVTFTPEIEAGKKRLDEIKKTLLETKKKRDMAWKAIAKEMGQKPARRNNSKLRSLRLKHKAFKDEIKELEREASLLAAQLADLGEALGAPLPTDQASDQAVSAETRLALARAGLTEGQEDDLAALRTSESEVASKLARETDIENQIGLTNELASIRNQIRAIENASKTADDIDKALLEREQAKREFAERASKLTQAGFGAFFPGLGLDAGGRVTVNINSAFPPTPEVSRQLGEALSQSFGNQGHVPATRETLGV